jgi:hypothetical protein
VPVLQSIAVKNVGQNEQQKLARTVVRSLEQLDSMGKHTVQKSAQGIVDLVRSIQCGRMESHLIVTEQE